MTSALLLAPVEDAATRRRFLTGVGAAGLLAACGAPSGPAAPAAPVGFPRTVSSGATSAELPGPPQRIYVTGRNDAVDALLALGIVPAVWTPYTEGPLPWQAQAGLADAATTDLEPDVEVLAAEGVDFALLRPEEYDAPVGERVRSLCPTLTWVAGTAGNLAMWGEVLGREDRAAELTTEFGQIMGEVRVPDAPVTAVVFPDTGVSYVYTGLPVIDEVFGPAGVPNIDLPAAVLGDSPIVELAEENYGLLEQAEVIVALQGYGITDAGRAFGDHPVIRTLPAVRNGRYVLLDEIDSNVITLPTNLTAPLVQDVLDRIYT